jgi:hypothetical protein
MILVINHQIQFWQTRMRSVSDSYFGTQFSHVWFPKTFTYATQWSIKGKEYSIQIICPKQSIYNNKAMKAQFCTLSIT